MRIAFLTELFPYYKGEGLVISGGGEARFYFLAKNLASKHEVHVITTRAFAGTKPFEEMGGFAVHRLVPFRGPGLASLFFARAALKFLRKEHFDAVDANQFLPHVVNCAAGHGGKIINTLHDVYAAYGGLPFWIKMGLVRGLGGWAVEKLQLKFDSKADLVIAVSEWTAQKAIKFGIPRHKLAIVPNGIDFKTIKRFSRAQRKPIIVCVSRFIEYKHQDHAVCAFAELTRYDPELQLHFVYSGSIGGYENRIRRLVQKLKLEKKIFFHKAVSEKEKFSLLSSARLMLFPSHVEGQGIAILEALACGTPVVAYNLPAYKGALFDGKNGFAARLGDVTGLASKALIALEKFSTLSKAASASAKRFDWTALAKKYEKLL